MICKRNSDNKYGFIPLVLRDLHLLFKQCMLLKKADFSGSMIKEIMQLKQRDILGNYAEKRWEHCPHLPAHKFAVVRRVRGRVAQMRDRVVREQRQINICTKYQHTEIDFLLFLLFFDESS